MQQDKTIVIDIKLSQGLLWILVTIALLSTVLLYLTLSERPAEASFQAQATGQRQYYLSKNFVRGHEPLTACASGYHMASLWEMADPSNLLYNTTLGLTRADSGSTSPGTGYTGWVRTGYLADDANIAGHANCNAWTSLSPGDYGTTVYLPDSWAINAEDLGVWAVSTLTCGNFQYVWCIED